MARASGEDLPEPETKLACLQVFALGGTSRSDDGAETGYFATPGAPGQRSARDAAAHIAQKGMSTEGAPALVRLIAMISTRFNVQVTEKAAAQAVPVIGAVAGALVNLAFTDHFQNISRVHFTVRRLERIYSPAVVQGALRSPVVPRPE
ncbi:EcsC family protein [Ramlibacter tataouinensis]|uniref:EcsC family protein n=1 Tax=Ramlibacter tataouinensis TaxID=94132 RepID=UPI0022F400A9|nr:EcsC family protein [Ramlibacter tataouinensis]WBY01546.1 EcsC family protein [Ramlibacter tataouinensis]